MPRYSFRCVQCGNEDVAFTDYLGIGHHHPQPCPLCGGRLSRMASFYYNKPMQAHYNPSLGHHVSNSREFKDGLKRASDEESLRTGMSHNYIEVDPTDAKSCGVTSEGLEEQQRAWHGTEIGKRMEQITRGI